MTKSLPPHPNLVHLKKQARALLRAHAQGQPDVCLVLRHLNRFLDVAVEEILTADVTLTEVQFALAIEYGFSSWTALKTHIEAHNPNDRLLHVHCGDSSADSLRKSGVGGKVITWFDPLIEGPTPANVSPTEWVRLRAENLLPEFDTVEHAAQFIHDLDKRLRAYRDFDEVVLWFDACLFDQVILIRQLDWFAREELGACKLSLICIGEFPGHPNFHGLGELSPTELASLLGVRHEVTTAETQLAVQAWEAYRTADPTAIERLLSAPTFALPYLRPALLRHLERFPACRNGLSRLEQEALEAIAAGRHSLWEIMRAASEVEHPAFFGDSYLFKLLESLASGPHPLVIEQGLERESLRQLPRREWPLAKANYTLTAEGMTVLHGEADWIVLQGGIDRWLGGVHLLGADSPWRWDEERQILVSR